ncbi:MAG: hypothetical protein U0586_09540 [Candidatus Brocadiaceae bacterium]
MKDVETQDFASLLRKRPSQFDGALHVVNASVCSDDFSRLESLREERSNLSLINIRHLLIRSKWVLQGTNVM